MVIITFKKIREYALQNANAKIALLHWNNVADKANWACFADVKKDFSSYRIVAMIHFDTRTIYIRFIGTHAEYDKIIAREA